MKCKYCENKYEIKSDLYFTDYGQFYIPYFDIVKLEEDKE